MDPTKFYCLYTPTICDYRAKSYWGGGLLIKTKIVEKWILKRFGRKGGTPLNFTAYTRP